MKKRRRRKKKKMFLLAGTNLRLMTTNKEIGFENEQKISLFRRPRDAFVVDFLATSYRDFIVCSKPERSIVR